MYEADRSKFISSRDDELAVGISIALTRSTHLGTEELELLYFSNEIGVMAEWQLYTAPTASGHFDGSSHLTIFKLTIRRPIT